METEHPLVRRARVAQAAADALLGRPFAWWDADCGRLAHLVVTGFGLASPMKAMHRYTTERGALKAIRKAGFKDLGALIDSLGFERIAPAEALPADLLGFPPVGAAFGVAIGVVLSAGHCLTFVDHEAWGGPRAVILKGVGLATFAWRVRA